MDVLTAAWSAHGCPLPADQSMTGQCARCSRDAALVATRTVVSKVFTAFDGWREPGGAGLCPACTWGFRAPGLRLVAHLVTSAPLKLQALDPPSLGQLLGAPLPAEVAVIVPLRPGRKHLLPEAVWGRVAVDDARLPWTASDVDRLAAMCRLRALGFGPRMLTEAAPAWPVLRRLPHSRWSQILGDWSRLELWRSRRPWFDLGVQASYTTTAAAA